MLPPMLSPCWSRRRKTPFCAPREDAQAILAANALDIEAGEANGLSPAMLDRLRLDPDRLEAIARGVEEVAELPDPVGEVITEWTRPNNISIEQVRVPIGVIGIQTSPAMQRCSA